MKRAGSSARLVRKKGPFGLEGEEAGCTCFVASYGTFAAVTPSMSGADDACARGVVAEVPSATRLYRSTGHETDGFVAGCFASSDYWCPRSADSEVGSAVLSVGHSW
jgi:hypothetical protein